MKVVANQGQPSVIVSDKQPFVLVGGGRQGIPGVPGAPGQDGVDAGAWLSGTTAPSNALGNDGQSYINTATGEVYKKTAGVWSVDFTLTANSVEYANVLNKPNLTYEFPFSDSTNIVVADHGMNKKPAVRVLDSAGTEWHGAVIDYTGTNGLVGITVTFTSLFGGKLILS